MCWRQDSRAKTDHASSCCMDFPRLPTVGERSCCLSRLPASTSLLLIGEDTDELQDAMLSTMTTSCHSELSIKFAMSYHLPWHSAIARHPPSAATISVHCWRHGAAWCGRISSTP